MVIRIAFFNQFVDEDYLTKICNCKVLSRTPCVSNEIRLRRNHSKFITFHNSVYHSSKIDSSYGMLFDLEIDDLDIFSLYHNMNCILKDIKVSTIYVENVDSFMKKDYKIIQHNIKCMCFVAKRNEINNKIYNNRKTVVNFNKRLLLNLLKI